MSYTDYYDEQAEVTGWLGPEVVFGLAYKYVRPGDTLLDLGIGTGLGSLPFHMAGLRVLGMDASEVMLEGTRLKGFAEDLQQHDLTSPPYPYADGSLDHVICVGVLNFIKDHTPVFHEAGRMLCDGGLFAFTVGDRNADEPDELTAGREHTGTDESVTIYMHSPEQVRRLLADHALTVARELEFVTYMDDERTKRLRARAYVALRDPRS